MSRQQVPNFEITHSLLRIDGQHLPVRASRGLRQDYQTEDLGSIERTPSGLLLFYGMVDDSGAPRTMISTSISAEDWYSMPVMIWPRSKIVTLECSEPMHLPGKVAPEDLPRRHCPGSIRYMNSRMVGLPRTLEPGAAVEGQPIYDGDGAGGTAETDAMIAWTRFRPVLRVMVEGWSIDGGEWQRNRSCTIAFREHDILPR